MARIVRRPFLAGIQGGAFRDGEMSWTGGSVKKPRHCDYAGMSVFVRNIPCDDSTKCMATDKQIIIDECRAAVAQYCCCDARGADASSRRDNVYYLDFVDMYEICLDVAQRVKGVRAMAWEEFLEISDCVFDSSRNGKEIL